MGFGSLIFHVFDFCVSYVAVCRIFSPQSFNAWIQRLQDSYS